MTIDDMQTDSSEAASEASPPLLPRVPVESAVSECGLDTGAPGDRIETAPLEHRALVNPAALKNCELCFGGTVVPLLDISFIRIVTAPFEGVFEGEGPVEAEFCLERIRFKAMVELKFKGDKYFRLGFTRLPPSSLSHLRSFLSPKKVGESFVEDTRAGLVRHYHGLKETEIWFEPGGTTLFTFVDDPTGESQILLRLLQPRGPLRVGRVLRSDYLELSGLDAEVPVLPLNESDSYVKLSECRDIVTNMRPASQAEYDLKQRLLRAISDILYSTNHRVEMHVARPMRSSSLPMDS